jgi:hypothetical protein
MNQAPLPNSRASALVVLGLAGITLYWTFTYSGPYRYFAELQIRWFGFYIPKLTALVVIVGLLVVGAVIKFVLKGAERSDEKAPVQLVVNMFEKDIKGCLHRETDGSFTVRGVVDRGLEGEVKYAFEKNGVAMGDPVWVIPAGHDPAGERKAGFLIMVVGILFAGFMAGLESFRKRKRIAAQQVPITA